MNGKAFNLSDHQDQQLQQLKAESDKRIADAYKEVEQAEEALARAQHEYEEFCAEESERFQMRVLEITFARQPSPEGAQYLTLHLAPKYGFEWSCGSPEELDAVDVYHGKDLDAAFKAGIDAQAGYGAALIIEFTPDNPPRIFRA